MAPGRHNQAEEVDLCLVVKDPRKYAGRSIRVTGELFIGSGGIVNNQCEAMVTRGYHWPTGLNLAPKRESSLVLHALQEARVTGKRKICLTVVGTIEAKRKYLVVTTPDGRQIGDGFGHLNVFPGQIRVDEVISAGSCESRE